MTQSINELKSYTEYNVNTPTSVFTIGFQYEYNVDGINVYVDDVEATAAGYTVQHDSQGTVTLTPAVPSGVVRLARETNIDTSAHTFSAGAKFTAGNMDENFQQIRHAQQEVRDGVSKLSDDTYEIIDTLQVVGQVAQDAADAAEQAAQVANEVAAQVNDKVSQVEIDYIHENGAALPYKDGLTYEENAVVVKDGVLQQWKGGEWTPIEKPLIAENVTDGNQTQEEINLYGGKKYDMPFGGYPVGAVVILENGEHVQSTVANNTADPNVDMAGWVNLDIKRKKIDVFSTIEQFGGGLGGDDTAAFGLAIVASNKIVLDGSKTYSLQGSAASALFANMLGKWIYGNGATIRIKGGDFGIKSPVASGIFDVKFVGDGDKRQRIWVSNYTLWYFMRCSFRNFCYSDLQEDTTALFMYAGSVNNTVLAAGDSKHGRLVDCDFDGERKTMFGVRIYTEFQTVNQSEYTNTDTQVIRGNFDQYMLNAVEIAGATTIACGVVGATAYNNGVSAFALDKGCQDCFVRNVYVDKLTGLPGTVWASNTRPSVVNISGTAQFGLFSSGNTVDGVTAKLYKSDLDALSAYGAAIVAISTSIGDTVKNVSVSLDGLPLSVTNGKMGLAMVVLSDAGGCSVSNIKSTHATHGIIEHGVTLASGSIKANKIKNIRSDNTLTGEVVGLAQNYEHARVYHIEDLRLATTMTTAKFTEATAINHKAQHANAYLDMSNVRIASANNNAISAMASKLGLRSCCFALPSRTSANLFNVANALTWLNLNDVRVNTDPLYIDLALAALTGSYVISTQTQASEFDKFESVNGGDLWVQCVAPTTPAVSGFPIAQRLRKRNFTSTEGYEFVRFGSTWRGVGTLI